MAAKSALVARWLGLALMLLGACQDPLGGLPVPQKRSSVQVLVESGEELEALPRVLRLRLELGKSGQPFGVAALELFADELSSYYVGRVVRGELPESLLERRVPMLSWQLEPGSMYAQPTRVLEPGRPYTLVAMGYGVLAELRVATEGAPLLWRIWPAPDVTGGALGGVYCAEASGRLEESRLVLAPDAGDADLRASAEAPDRCAVLTVTQPASQRVPSPSVPGWLLDPAPLTELGAEFALTALECQPGCLALGPGCLCADDDRAFVTGPVEPALWMLELQGRFEQYETRATSSFLLSGLEPAHDYAITGSAYDLRGAATPLGLSFRTGAARAHIAINEVYSNPNGPEPVQEWLELVNSGSLAENLEGYLLEDVGGETGLPEAWLEPGAFAVVVNQGYEPDPELDPVPAPTALLIRVERLGKNGLSNAGELIRLRSPDGQVVSRFPMSPAPKPGVSVARRTAAALDDDSTAFALHAPPGCSPGAANTLQAATE